MKISTVIVGLLLFAVVLFLVNVLLLFSVKISEKTRKYTEFSGTLKINKDTYMSIFHLPMDHSEQYYLHRNFISSEKTPGFKDLVLVSHCTGDHLHHLVTLSETWNGPISVAIFVPGYNLEDTLSTLIILYRCFTTIHERVSVHLVYPVAKLPEIDDLMFHIQKARAASPKCTNPVSLISSKSKDVDSLKNYARETEYPNNLLRNIAWHSINVQYSLVIDIDMMPNKGLYSDFMAFAGRNKLFENGNSFYNDKSVFVLPAFEIDTIKELPKSKASLVTLIEKNRARPFYYDICWKCQKPTDYEKWRNLEDVGQNVNVGYEVKWKDPWEPFFIAPRTSPDYDERFKQYGFNRISQACELHVAGFKFFVLDRGFVVHRGFKNMDSFHKSKNKENDKNRILFRTFKADLKLKYPQSNRRCY